MAKQLLLSLVRRALSHTVGEDKSVFLQFEQELEDHFYNLGSMSHNLSEVKDAKGKNKKKGDLFEELCLQLILLDPPVFRQTSLHGVSQAWLFKDVPKVNRDKLYLSGKDYGIDIVVRKEDRSYLAIQCKYRKKPRKQQYYQDKKGGRRPIAYRVKYKDLSTFFCLCDRTGPRRGWARRIVMTNCEGTNHQGKKTEQDLSICRKTLERFDRSVWARLSGDTGHTVNESEDDEEPVSEKKGEGEREESSARK